MAIKAQCPHCDKEYSLPETLAAKKVRCKQCTTVFVVETWTTQQTAITATRRRSVKPQKPAPDYEETTDKYTVEDDTDDREKASLPKKKPANNKPPVASIWALWLLLVGGGMVLFLVLVGGVGVYFALGRKGDKPSDKAVEKSGEDKSGGDQSGSDKRGGDKGRVDKGEDGDWRTRRVATKKVATQANYDKLHEGMTEAELKAVLGEPGVTSNSDSSLCLIDHNKKNSEFYGPKLPADFKWPVEMIWGDGNQQIRAIVQNGLVASVYASLGPKNTHKGKEYDLDAIIRASLPRLKKANISKVTFDSIKSEMNEDVIIAIVGEQPIRYGSGPWGDERLLWYDDRGVIDVFFINHKCCGKMCPGGFPK